MTISNSDPADPSQEGPLVWNEGDMPYSTEFGDHFYSRDDGRLECGHVFIDGNRLPVRWTSDTHQAQTDRPFRIGELGFGTGLNLCETWRQWKAIRPVGVTLHFVSFEMYPMAGPDIDRALTRWPEIDDERQALLAAWPDRPEGMVDIELDATTRLTVVCGDALAGVTGSSLEFDAWYLDGFAPSRNGAMWSEPLMQALFSRTVPGGTFATYAAAGFVRRNLQAAGFIVERAQGYAGKREMLRGEKSGSAAG